jgi:hypothetical protein
VAINFESKVNQERLILLLDLAFIRGAKALWELNDSIFKTSLNFGKCYIYPALGPDPIPIEH